MFFSFRSYLFSTMNSYNYHLILSTSKLVFNVFFFFSFRSSLFLTMSARQCKTNPNKFCYIRGELTFAKEKHSITSHIKKMYMAYFDCYFGDQDKSWAPHVCCVALPVWRHCMPGMQEKMFTWSLVCQWFGVSRKITLMIAISVSMTLQAVLQRGKRNTLFIWNQHCAQ